MDSLAENGKPSDFDESPKSASELELFFGISQILERSLDLDEVLNPVLDFMAEKLGMLYVTVTLLNRNTNEIIIEAAYGIPNSARAQSVYKPGEGITGRVVQSGKPIVIPRISQEPLFLDKTGVRKSSKTDISYISVPVRHGKEVIGTLSGDRVFDPERDLEEDVRIFTVISSMIGQALKIRQQAEEERRALQEENLRLQGELKRRFKPANIIGNSSEMQEVFDLVQQVCKSDATVLIRGESGTGKELVAHAIHYNSHRADKPFIRVNCAALPESVIESELFGHEKGAFTGAVATRKGRFELANGGSIFLDEIGDLSPQVQVKLLRVLQEKEFERVGGSTLIRTNVRIIAATNRNLEEAIAQKQFREDLYYRLNVFPIHMPALRERKSDIMLLADYFVERYASMNGKPIQRISTPAIDLLMSYHWPGNVRELENCIERAVLLSSDGVIHGNHLPPSLQSAESTGTRFKGRLDDVVGSLERELIIEALKTAKGNMSKAARALGITERQMGLRVDKYAIDPKRYKD
jgi:Nif-specific regulatory protein